MDRTKQGSLSMKLVLVGDGSVGKTSMLISYTTDKFPDDYVPTIFDNYLATIKFQDHLVKLWLWDTAGQEEYRRLRHLSYPTTDVFLICFSMIDCKSFNHAINKWLPEINENCPNAIKIFVGTKQDLYTEYEMSYNLKKRNPILLPISVMENKIKSFGHKLMTCSALSQDGLNATFSEAIRQTILKKEQSLIVKKPKDTECQII